MADTGRPHVNMTVLSEPAEPMVGQPLRLTFQLTDGGTGLPVDDLAPHHEALLHLVVIDETGTSFEHLHPARVAPGRFVTELVPSRPGRHTAYMELSRHASGSQIVARDFVVSGDAVGTPPAAAGLGPREVGGVQIDVTSSTEALQAGRQSVLTFRLSEGGTPVADVQPWLGMAGHLIARSADETVFSHVHAAERMAEPGPMGQALQYGPEIRFVYTFPTPGRYHAWAQFQRAGEIITVPMLLDVAAEAPELAREAETISDR
jgi:hypothetical protein